TPADAHAAPASAAIQQDVGDGDRHFLGESASLRIAAVRLHVPVHAVDALHQDFVLFGQNPEHPAGLAGLRTPGVITGDYFHDVVFFDVHDLNHLVGQTHDLHEAGLAQLARDRAENPGAARIHIFFIQE